MTVSEFIEVLKNMPQNMEIAVQYRDDGGCYSGCDYDIEPYIDKSNNIVLI